MLSTLMSLYSVALGFSHGGVMTGELSLVHAGSQVVSSRDHVVQKGEATKF